MQQGEHTASNIKRLLNGESTQDFQYVNRGTVCSLGTMMVLELYMVEISLVKSSILEESY